MVGFVAKSELLSYSSGVYTGSACSSSDETNHFMQAVGYGNESGYDYVLVKNSWGTDWGEEGYVKVWMTSGNVCRIYDYAYYSYVGYSYP